jgi:hypothetical protein
MQLLAGVSITLVPALANDSAAAFTTQGLELKQLDGVTLVKEVLKISKVARPIPSNHHGLPTDAFRFPIYVSYVFENTTEFTQRTLVAFPLPLKPEPCRPDLVGLQPFIENFELIVDGKRQTYQSEHKAISTKTGKDVTAVLQKFQLDYVNYSGLQCTEDGQQSAYQVAQLDLAAKNELQQAGAINEYLAPYYEIKTTHYWRQTFPAKQKVHIEHSYDASPGFAYLVNAQDLKETNTNTSEWGCMDDALKTRLHKAMAKKPGAMLHWSYVDYIVTTANNWDGAIAEFELHIERPAGEYVSLCWPGKVEKSGPNKFKMTAKDFVPTDELKVFWYKVG